MFRSFFGSDVALCRSSSLLTSSQENKRLSEPLKEALADVAELHSDLKDREKDRMSLTNAKARLKLKDEQVRG